jgi:hypothetical protein
VLVVLGELRLNSCDGRRPEGRLRSLTEVSHMTDSAVAVTSYDSAIDEVLAAETRRRGG